jgi:two-component system, chemotaxis family, CheB/CheR fusion protein
MSIVPAHAKLTIDLTGVHVFVVEDNEDACQLLQEVLAYCGALVHLSHTTEAALAHLTQFLPTVILCDLALPGADGFAFIRALRALPPARGGQLPAIAISAHYEDFARPEALRLGFNEFLRKPLNLDQLCSTISRLLRTNERAATEDLS